MQRISGATEQRLADGCGLLFITLTVQHVSGTALKDSLEWLRLSLRAITRGSASRDLRRAREDIGWNGYIRTLEVTYGKNGFHPHFHLAVFLDSPDVASEALDRFTEALTSAWIYQVTKHGGKAPSRAHGVDVRRWEGDPATLGQYLSKAVGQELTGAEFKTRSKNGSLTMWQVMAAAAQGDSRMFQAYEEYIEATRGVRFISSSKGMLPRMDEDQEEADAVEAAQSDRRPEFFIDALDWAASDHRALAPGVLALLRSGGSAPARTYLEAQGITTYGWGEITQFDPEAVPPPRAANGRFAPRWITPFEASLSGLEGKFPGRGALE